MVAPGATRTLAHPLRFQRIALLIESTTYCVHVDRMTAVNSMVASHLSMGKFPRMIGIPTLGQLITRTAHVSRGLKYWDGLVNMF